MLKCTLAWPERLSDGGLVGVSVSMKVSFHEGPDFGHSAPIFRLSLL